MTKYRKKPVVIDAIQWLGDNWEDIEKFSPYGILCNTRGKFLTIQTDAGTMTAQIGDWIIKGVKGEVYPCKPDIFEATYTKEE